MATPESLIARSLRLLGQIGAGEDPTDDEETDGLEAMNAMLDSWRNERLMAYALQEETLTLANGTSSYSVGPSGALNTTRPVAIEGAWIVHSTTSYSLQEISEAQYAALQDKTTESEWPDRFLYRPSMSTGTLIVYPVPNATRTLKLQTRVPLAALTAGTTIALPPGWERALAYNLAVEIAPEYEVEASPSVVGIAREAKAAIKRINVQATPTVTEVAAAFPGGHPNILTDQ